MLKASFIGIDQFKSRIESAKKEIKDEVDAEVMAAAMEFAGLAKRDPIDSLAIIFNLIRVRPGFEPETSRTLSEKRTPTPTSLVRVVFQKSVGFCYPIHSRNKIQFDIFKNVFLKTREIS